MSVYFARLSLKGVGYVGGFVFGGLISALAMLRNVSGGFE